MENLEQLDGLFMTALQKAEGINNFFDGVFGFLMRKSDFFTNKESSKNIVEASFKKFLGKFEEKAEKERKKQKQAEEEKRINEQKTTEKITPQVKELTKEEFERAKMEEELRNKINSNPELKEKIENTNKEESKSEEKEEDKIAEGKVRPNKGNGYNCEKYIWYQYQIEEITIIIPVEKKITGKDIKIKYDSKHLNVTVSGDSIIAGELKFPMNSDSFLWVLDETKDGKIINITFNKLDNWKWWDCIIKGDQEIDTSKINPEPSKLSDLDGDMRGQVEKMMFDTRQKQMGLPSSDELKKQDMLKKFMDAHPEMDFSKAKFG